MKKLTILLAILPLLFSCTDSKLTTYQVTNTSSNSPSYTSYLDGNIYEVEVYCFSGSTVIRTDYYPVIRKGETTKPKETPISCDRVYVSFRFIPQGYSGYNTISNRRRYSKSSVSIEDGKNTVVKANSYDII